MVAETSMMHGLKVAGTADIDAARAREAYAIGRIEGEVVALTARIS